MEDKRVADYFIIAGVPDNLSTATESKQFFNSTLPITDIAVIFKGLGETCPEGFKCIDKTPDGHDADLNSGNFKSQNIFICYRTGNDKPPIVEVGVLYEGKERVLQDIEIVRETPYGRCASISGSGNGKGTYITFRRSSANYSYNQLVVVDLSVVLCDKDEAPPRAFLVIKKNLNTSFFQGMIGSGVNLCYKKTILSPPSLNFEPQILSRFPLKDYELPLGKSLPIFCLPTGANIELWPSCIKKPLPQSSNFVLTSDSAQKIYGSSLSFYEPYDKSSLSFDQKVRIGLIDDDGKEFNAQNQLYAIKSICILSRWPFFECFKRYLFFLHRLVFRESILRSSGNQKNSPGKLPTPLQVPLEHYISHFMLDVVFPTAQRPRVVVQLMSGTDEDLEINQPSSNLPLPLTGASFLLLLKILGVENTMSVLLFGLSEQKILLHSLVPAHLTYVAEAITAMLFPFHWQCPYIPVCPLKLSGILNAPLPFIAGVDSRCFDQFTPPDDVICIDLDAKTIRVLENKRCLNLKALPKRAGKILKNSLEVIYAKILALSAQTSELSPQHNRLKIDTSIDVAKRRIELEAREAFVIFMATILKDFRQYLLPITKAPTVGATDPTSLFNFEGFLMSRDRHYSQFYEWITKTQMFTHYIEERSFVSDKDTSLAFFDDCEEELSKYPNKRISLFEREDSIVQTDRSVYIPAPEVISASQEFDNVDSGSSAQQNFLIFPKFGPLNSNLYHKHPPEKLEKKFSIPSEHNLDTNSLTSQLNLNDPCLLFESNQVNSLTGIMNNHNSFSISRRTKQEIKTSQRMAKMSRDSPLMWSKYLVSCCHSVWFAVLPSFMSYTKQCQQEVTNTCGFETNNILREAYSTVVKMKQLELQTDELCFRVLTLLCGYYGNPALAVRVYFEMKKCGIVPNAVTYGYYNKAVLESTWPDHMDTRSPAMLWSKIRNVFAGIASFKFHGRKRGMQRRTESDQQLQSSKHLTNEGTDNDEGESIFDQASQYVVNEFDFPFVSAASILKKNSLRSSTVASKSVHRSNSMQLKSSLASSKFVEMNSNLDSSSNKISKPKKATIQKSKSFQLENQNLEDEPPNSVFDKQKQHQNIEREILAQSQSIHTQLTAQNEVDGNVSEDVDYDGLDQVTQVYNCDNDDCGCEGYDEEEDEDEEYDEYEDEDDYSDKDDDDDDDDDYDPSSKRHNNVGCRHRRAVTKSNSKALDALSLWSKWTPSQNSKSAVYKNIKSAASGLVNSFQGIKSSLATPASKQVLATTSTSNRRAMMTSNMLTPVQPKTTKEMLAQMANYFTYNSFNFDDLDSFGALTNKHHNHNYQKSSSDEDLLNFSLTDELEALTVNDSNDTNANNALHYSKIFQQFDAHYKSQYASSLQSSNDNEESTNIATSKSTAALEIVLTTCCKCAVCQSLLYDEEIMNRWSQNESNLNSECVYCRATIVPLMTVELRDYRKFDSQALIGKTQSGDLKPARRTGDEDQLIDLSDPLEKTKENESDTCQKEVVNSSCNTPVPPELPASTGPTSVHSFQVPYLSPIVSWKELESIFENYGDNCASSGDFVDKHPIVFYNLLWFFTRVRLPTHLAKLCLSSESVLNGKQLTSTTTLSTALTTAIDLNKVTVITLWDNETIHTTSGKPMYKLWTRDEPSRQLDAILADRLYFSKSFLERVVSLVKHNEICKAMTLVLNERLCSVAKFSFDKNRHNLYRDLLFLLHEAEGKLCTENFAKEYMRAFNSLNFNHVALNRFDKPPSLGSLFCRNLFSQLALSNSQKPSEQQVIEEKSSNSRRRTI